MLPIMSNLIIDNQYKPGEAVGDLATSWTVSGDGLTYTFRMRSGVRYTDNTPLTSADVVWNFTQGWKPIKPGISNTQSVWSAVSDIKPVDPTTIQITLKQVSAAFLGLLSQTSLHIYPRHVIGDTRDFTSFAKNPIGSGAYYRSDFKPAVSWHMRANPAYYGKDSAGRQLPYLDGIDSFIILDNAAVNAAVRAGRIDVVDVFTGTPVRTDKAVLERELKYEFFLGSGTRFDLMLRNRPPWNNKVVRQALSMGIDRKLIVDTVELGLGTHLASPMTSPIQGGYWGLPADEMAKLPGFQQPHDADFQAAVKALRDNGVKEGTAFGYTVFIFFQRTGEVDVVATQLQKLGFKVALDIHTSGPAIIERVSRGDFDAFRSTAAITFDDPSQSITPFIGSGQGRNYGPWSFPKIDQLLAEQDKTLDVNKRRELLFEAQRLIIDEAAVIPVSYGASLMGWPPYVKNHPRWAFSFGPQWKYDQVWLDR
jgi:peptide/nickel transport system substrate-binding protein